jgi:hypothetical protein
VGKYGVRLKVVFSGAVFLKDNETEEHSMWKEKPGDLFTPDVQ